MKPEILQEQVSCVELLPFFEEILQQGQTLQLTVTGNSMMPLLRNRKDTVCLKQKDRICTYDVVLYVDDAKNLILHRIVKKTKDGYMIVGDNQTMLDGPVPPEKILATMVGFYRSGHYFPCDRKLVKFYAFVWGSLYKIRRPLLPVLLFCGRRIKHLGGKGKHHEMDHQ